MNNTTENDTKDPILPWDIIGVILSFLEPKRSFFLVSKEFSSKAEENLWFPLEITREEDLKRPFPKRISCITLRTYPHVCRSFRDTVREQRSLPRVNTIEFHTPVHEYSFPVGNNIEVHDERNSVIAEILRLLGRVGTVKVSNDSFDRSTLYFGKDLFTLFERSQCVIKNLRICSGFKHGYYDDVFASLQSNTTVTSLEFLEPSNDERDPYQRETLASFLETNTTLCYFRIGVFQFCGWDSAEGFEALSRNTSLTSLELRSPTGAGQIRRLNHVFHGMENNTSIHHLCISTGAIGQPHLESIYKMLETNTTLDSLSFHDIWTRDEDAAYLLQGVGRSNRIRTFEISLTSPTLFHPTDQLGGEIDEFRTAITNFLASNQSITQLSFNMKTKHPFFFGRGILQGIGMNRTLERVCLPSFLLNYLTPKFFMNQIASSSLREIDFGNISKTVFLNTPAMREESPSKTTLKVLCEECKKLSPPVEIFYQLV